MQISDHFRQTGFYTGERSDLAPARFLAPDTYAAAAAAAGVILIICLVADELKSKKVVNHFKLP